MLTDEARAARNAYARKWAAENRDKTRAAQERYWERRAVVDDAMARMFAAHKAAGTTETTSFGPESRKRFTEELQHYIEVVGIERRMKQVEIEQLKQKIDQATSEPIK